MSDCPRCREPLAAGASPWGVVFGCLTCKGQAVTLPVLRRVARRALLAEFWFRMQRSAAGPLHCPFCTRPMLQASLGTPPVTVDSCVPCQSVWFDKQKVGSVAAVDGERPPPEPEVLVNTLRSVLESVGRPE